MDACAQVLDAVSSGSAMPADLTRHAAGCPHCAPVMALSPSGSGARTAAPPLALDKWGGKAREALGRKPRARSWLSSLGVILFVEAVIGAASWAAISRHGWVNNAAPRLQLAVIAGMLMLTVLSATVAALTPRRGWAAGTLALAAVTGLAVTLGGSDLRLKAPVEKLAATCGTFECLVALVPMAFLLFFLTRFAARPSQALVAGVAAAGTGALVLHFHCPNGAPEHLFLGHVLPMFAYAALALGIRRRLPTKTFAP